ncbi:hypothetical protein VE01_08935 [Pseudogymnoascus verrucosus]|uniref:Uncharacterized protein n=1 Tax=Pseudogymnoascus verrucosus TaxID=342668 RepID=A0A1B8GAN1_9PEZI|nr:uncharacterized protein VE01_08935 [Pseudogymnoascus verrucosus]OBT92884.1 hypothetical protein VE01_08935 [Pseudogymnoascus verrucosus]
MMSIRAEMRELLDTWSDWATPADNRIQSCLNNIWASFLFILCFLLAVVVKGYLISAYLLSFIWPWSSRNRKTNGLQQFAFRAGNTISVVPHQEQNQDITRKSENILFHRIPFEIRRQILMQAFGDQTVHMDLQFRYPLELADECLFYDYHARIEGTSMNPWDWYVAIDCFLMEKQGKEETRMHRADVEGLKCWRNTPGRIEDVSDGVLDSGVEGRRKGFWIHICIYDVELDKCRNYSYDQDRHDLYNLGPERYRFREETVIDTNSFVYHSDY